MAGIAFAALLAIAGPAAAAVDAAASEGSAATGGAPQRTMPAVPGPAQPPKPAHPVHRHLVRRGVGSPQDHSADRLNAQELRRLLGGYPAYGRAFERVVPRYPPPWSYRPRPWHPPPAASYRPAPGWYPPP